VPLFRKNRKKLGVNKKIKKLIKLRKLEKK
jgi:hypothetical protein